MAVHTSVDPVNRKAVSPAVHFSGFKETGRRTSLKRQNSIQDKSGIRIEVFWKLTRLSSYEASLGNRPEADSEWVGVKAGAPAFQGVWLTFPSCCEVVWDGAYTHSFVRHTRQQIQYTRTSGCYYLYTGTPIVRDACKCVVLCTSSIRSNISDSNVDWVVKSPRTKGLTQRERGVFFLKDQLISLLVLVRSELGFCSRTLVFS